MQPAFRHPEGEHTPPAARRRAGGREIEPAARRELEGRFGTPFDDVRVHTDTAADERTGLLGARAYTVGADVTFGRGEYRPDSAAGRNLLSHELTHVVQQRRGGDAPPGPRQEAEARAVAMRPPGAAAVAVGAASASGLAFSVDDWLESTPDVRSMSFSAITRDIDEIGQWLDRQISSTPESARLEEALGALRGELARRSDRRAAAASPRRRRTGEAEPGAATPEVPPRIIVERTSVQYGSSEEVAAEIDRILAWLERSDLSRADRTLLRDELVHLAPQFESGRRAAAVDRQSARVARALTGGAASDEAQLENVSGVLRSVVPDPARPGVFVLIHEGERLDLGAEQVARLRSDVQQHFRQGARRVGSRIDTGFGYYESQLAVNRDSPVIAAIAGILGDAGDPGLAMSVRRGLAEARLAEVDSLVAAGDFAAAAKALALAERLGVQIERAGRAFNAAHISGAELAVTGLEITRDVSFAIAASIGAVVVAPVVTVGTGATAIVTGSLGTSAVVGAGSGLLRGGSAAGGELLAGNSTTAAGAAFRREGARGVREGVATGLTGGLGHSAGAAFGLAKEGAKLSTRLAVEAGADVTGGTVGRLLEGQSLGHAVSGAGRDALLGVPGSAVGGVVRGAGPRVVAESAVSGLTAAGGALATGGSVNEAILSGTIAGTSSAAVGGVSAGRTHPGAGDGLQTQGARHTPAPEEAGVSATTAHPRPPSGDADIDQALDAALAPGSGRIRSAPLRPHHPRAGAGGTSAARRAHERPPRRARPGRRSAGGDGRPPRRHGRPRSGRHPAGEPRPAPGRWGAQRTGGVDAARRRCEPSAGCPVRAPGAPGVDAALVGVRPGRAHYPAAPHRPRSRAHRVRPVLAGQPGGSSRADGDGG